MVPSKRSSIAPASWVYWLQDADPAVLAQADTDLVVIDYSHDGSAKRAYTKQEIRRMQRAGKTVLCYFSIGEAESYRFYWQKEWRQQPPAFLGNENPDWAENYKVRFWYEDWWRTALQPYLDTIIAQGFDGVYLDIVDAYWYWHDNHDEPLRTMANEMVSLVIRIAHYARAKAGNGFIVCPQNGVGIIDAASPRQAEKYLQAIDMVGVESLLYNTTPEDRDYRTAMLSRFAAQKRPVMLIEYIEREQVKELHNRIADLPFPVTVYRGTPDAALDTLVPQN